MNSKKYEIIKRYIDEYDYYSLLEMGAPKDEFDDYSKRVSEMITGEESVDEIAIILANILDKAFGNEVKPENYIDIAEQIKNTLNLC